MDSEGEPLLLHNETPLVNHWQGVKLIGANKNKDGYGAAVTATLSDHRRLMRLCRADGSYMSSSDARVHFGLGSISKIETLTIRWPDGHMQTVNAPPTDRYITVVEDKN